MMTAFYLYRKENKMLKVKGKPYGLERNMGAEKDLMAICPNGSTQNLGKLFQGDENKIVESYIQVAIILNKAYENKKKYEDSEYQPCYLTREDILYGMSLEEFNHLGDEVNKCLTRDAKTTVEAEEPKSSKKAKRAKIQESD